MTRLSWLMNDRLRRSVELGLAPQLGGVVDQELESLDLEELEALEAWLEDRVFAQPDRDVVALLIASKQP